MFDQYSVEELRILIRIISEVRVPVTELVVLHYLHCDLRAALDERALRPAG